MTLTIYKYNISEQYMIPHTNFDECSEVEFLFMSEINKFKITDNINEADVAYIPIFLASHYHMNRTKQHAMDSFWHNYFNKIIAPENVRKKIPHFVLYSYVLVDVDFSCIPKDIKILAYENEVTTIKNQSILSNNGCYDRIITIPYILGSQHSFSKKINSITSHIYDNCTEAEIINQYKSRKALAFVGTDVKRSKFIEIRANIIKQLQTLFPEMITANPLEDDIDTPYKNAKFALVLRGDTPTRKAFYTALSMSCIPIIFEKTMLHYGELFNGSLPIEDIVLTIPEYNEHDPEYIQKITHIIDNAINDHDMQIKKIKLIKKIFSELNYFNNINNISAPIYNSILSVTGKHKRLSYKQPFIYCYDTYDKFCKNIFPISISPQEIFNSDNFNVNNGYGKKLDNNIYQTSQYSLEIIWHQKIMQYPLLTSSIEKANICFVPFFTFLTSWKNIPFHYSVSDANTMIASLFKYIPQWIVSPLPHIFVFSDVIWNDERVFNHHFKFPSNTYILTLESTNNKYLNQLITVPYPTEFHKEITGNTNFYNKFNNINRTHLLSYIGRDRWPLSLLNSIKDKDFNCHILTELDERYWKSINDNQMTKKIIDIYGSSKFSLQPFGDMGTRRGFYQSVQLGCIPVIFDDNYSSYSKLFNNMLDINKMAVVINKNNINNIFSILQNISSEKIMEYKNYISFIMNTIQYSNYNDINDAIGTVINILNKK